MNKENLFVDFSYMFCCGKCHNLIRQMAIKESDVKPLTVYLISWICGNVSYNAQTKKFILYSWVLYYLWPVTKPVDSMFLSLNLPKVTV